MVEIRHHAALLVLATVALAAGLEVPPAVRDGTRSHITSRRYNQIIIYNLLCRRADWDIRANVPKVCSSIDNNAPFLSDHDDTEIGEEDNYNGEGYRKEQWHNYPRRLDRLQRGTLRRMAQIDSMEAQDVEGRGEPERTAGFPDEQVNRPQVKLWHLGVATSNPNTVTYDTDTRINYNGEYADLEKSASDDFLDADDRRHEKGDDTRRIEKRIFSLWSRLHGLGPVSHELQHRRHFYATYAAPGGLTAETRGGLLRPAGSPLRWG